MSELDPPPSPILTPFWEFLKNFGWLATALIGLGFCPSILQFALSVGPEWPHDAATATYSTVGLWAMMLGTYGRWHNASQSLLKNRLAWCFGLTLFFFAVYTGLVAFFIEYTPDSEKVTKGFFLFDHWEKSLQTGTLATGEPAPYHSVPEILRGNDWKAYELWPQWTISLNRYLILGSWVFAFTSLGALTSVFLLLQEKKAASRKRPVKRT